MPKTKGVVFDFDGTLTELTLDFGHLREAVVDIARRYVPEETIRLLEGRFIIEMIYEIETVLGDEGPEFKREAFECLRLLEVAASKGKAVYPYARDVLTRLRKKGARIGIVTRTCLEVVKGVFPDVDAYAEAVVTREHLKEVKPHPGQIFAICDLLSIRPEEGMLAGDHPTDVAAGIAAGMATVGLLSGRTTRREFEVAGATYILDDIRGVPILID